MNKLSNFELRARLQAVVDHLLAAVDRLAAKGVHEESLLAALAAAQAIVLHPELLTVGWVDEEIAACEWGALGHVPRRRRP